MVRLRPPEEAFSGIASSRPVFWQKHLLSNSGRQLQATCQVRTWLEARKVLTDLCCKLLRVGKKNRFVERLIGSVTKYLPVMGYRLVKSARLQEAKQRVSHCLPCPAAVSGHMFEGELMFRIDRIMPEFQVESSDPRTSKSIVADFFVHADATSRAGSSAS